MSIESIESILSAEEQVRGMRELQGRYKQQLALQFAEYQVMAPEARNGLEGDMLEIVRRIKEIDAKLAQRAAAE